MNQRMLVFYAGYDNSLANMQTFLIGRGPDFATPTSTLPNQDESHKAEKATIRLNENCN